MRHVYSIAKVASVEINLLQHPPNTASTRRVRKMRISCMIRRIRGVGILQALVWKRPAYSQEKQGITENHAAIQTCEESGPYRAGGHTPGPMRRSVNEADSARVRENTRRGVLRSETSPESPKQTTFGGTDAFNANCISCAGSGATCTEPRPKH